MIKRVVNISKNWEEAEKWDIQQYNKMSHEERQEIARTLKKRVYGTNNPDVRASQQNQ